MSRARGRELKPHLVIDAVHGTALLKLAPLLAALSEADIARLCECAVWRRFEAGETVLPHLTKSTFVCFVAEGTVVARLSGPAGRSMLFRRMGAGATFGEIAALTGLPRTLSVTAETEALAACCPQDKFLDLMQANASFAADVARHLARIAVSLTERVFELGTLEVRYRIYAELLRLAASGERDDEGRLTFELPTHEDIAASVGAQREAVTRELRLLAKDGIVRQQRRRLTIFDEQRLRLFFRKRAGDTTSEALDWKV